MNTDKDIPVLSLLSAADRSDVPIETKRRMLEPPNCPFRVDCGKQPVNDNLMKGQEVQQSLCSAVSLTVGRMTPISPVFCNVTCRMNGGPYMGRLQTDADRLNFSTAAMQLAYGRFMKSGFLEKILRKHRSDVTVCVPDWLDLADLREKLQPMYDHPLVERVVITGSAIIKGTPAPPKDLDLVVVVSDMKAACDAWAANEFRPLMPKRYRKVGIDWFVLNNPSGWFTSLDIEDRCIWRSTHSKCQIDPSITGGVRDSANFGDYDDLLERLFMAEAIVDTDLDATDEQNRAEIIRRLTGKTEEQVVADHDGLRLGDRLSTILRAVSMGLLKTDGCSSCDKRRRLLNRIGGTP